jgi:hypothetical protein
MSRTSLKKRAVVFASLLALVALVMPITASAASWGVVGSTHDLDQGAGGSGLTFLSTDATIGWGCGGFSLHANVTSAAVLTIQSGTFTNCMGAGSLGTPCTTTVTGTFPWQATGITTTNIQIHNVNLHILYENTPGNVTACPANGIVVNLTGTLASPNHTHWIAAQHEAVFVNATGLVGHSAIGDKPMALNGTLRDTAQTLVLS